MFKRIIGILCIVFVLLSAYAAKRLWIFSADLVDGVTLHQVAFTRKYYIRTENDVVIDNVDGWLIRKQYVYGACDETSFFLIDRRNFDVVKFDKMWKLSDFLELHAIPIYDMSDEENITHLQFGGTRKYHN